VFKRLWCKKATSNMWWCGKKALGWHAGCKPFVTMSTFSAYSLLLLLILVNGWATWILTLRNLENSFIRFSQPNFAQGLIKPCQITLYEFLLSDRYIVTYFQWSKAWWSFSIKWKWTLQI
jgi:hypothetical protein